MAFTFGGVRFEVVKEGSEDLKGDGQGHVDAQMVYSCAWSDLQVGFLALLGYPAPPYNTGRPRKPHQHPRFTALYCMDISIIKAGHATPSTTVAGWDYDRAHLVCTYHIPSFNLGNPDDSAGFDNLTYGSVHIESSVQVVSGGDGVFAFGDGTPAGPLVKNVHLREYHFTFEKIHTINYDLFDSLNGTVNAATFSGRSAQTLLLLGPSTQRVLGPTFQPFQLGFKIVYRSVGWNKVWRPGHNPEWDTPNPLPYATGDWTPLLLSSYT